MTPKIGAPFINTQLQLGGKMPVGDVEPFQRFFLTTRLKLLKQFVCSTSQGTSLK